MWRCKNVASALAEKNYELLPWRRRMGLKLHVALCFVCHGYHKQVMIMQDVTRKFHEHEENDDLAPETELGDDAKQRIKEVLKKQG